MQNSNPRLSRVALPLSLFSLIALAIPAAAQDVGGQWDALHDIAGTQELGRFGSYLASGGDINNDGHGDFLVGASTEAPGGVDRAGAAYAFSGADGSVLWTVNGLEEMGYLDTVAGVGDLDGDMHDDFAVGAQRANPGGFGGTGRVWVYSGQTGALLHTFTGPAAGAGFGDSMAGGGDFNNDGTPDIAIGAPVYDPGGVFNAGSIYVYSGADWSELARFDGPGASYQLGENVAFAGDVNGDGFDDLIGGAPFAGVGGEVFVYSGMTHTVLHTFLGAGVDDSLGTGIAGIGDYNGDGMDDMLVGAPLADPGGVDGAGEAFIFSGADGSQLDHFMGTELFGDFGRGCAGGGDVNGDGINDIVIGASFDAIADGQSGAAFAYSGADGSLIRRFAGLDGQSFFGGSVAIAPDMDGNGNDEVVVSAFLEEVSGGPPDQPGAVHVYGLTSYLQVESNELSVGSGDSVAIEIDFPDSEAGVAYALLISAAGDGPTNLMGVEVPLTPDVFYNRMLTGWVPPILDGAFGVLDGNGDAKAHYMPAPALVGRVGTTFYCAAVTYDLGPRTPRLSSAAGVIEVTP